MTGEVQFIRKQFFGGFKRKDVSEYITKIAKERNDERDKNAKAQETIDELKAEIEKLNAEIKRLKSETQSNRQKPVETVSEQKQDSARANKLSVKKPRRMF